MGASHITLGCRDIDAAAISLRALGYAPEFVDTNVANGPSKRAFLSGWSDRHAISLLRSADGFPIELVSYPVEMPDSAGRYVGLFKPCGSLPSSTDASLEPVRGTMVAHGIACDVRGLPGFEQPILCSTGEGSGGGLGQIVVPVENLQQAREFWCDGLGFKCSQLSDEMARLTFVAPVAAWRLDLALVKSAADAGRPLLNSRGMACLSFLSSNIEADISRLVARGADLAATTFTVTINGKDMNVAILLFGGAFVELLQIVPGRTGALS